MPLAAGGAGSASSPGWIMRAAHAACDATVIAMRAADVGVELSTLEVTVGSESDDRGLFGTDDDVPAGSLETVVRIRIGADGVPEGELQDIVHYALAHSPIGSTVSRAVPLREVIEIA